MERKSTRPGEEPPRVLGQRVLESVTDGILVVDRDKKILYANPVMARMYNLKPEELVGRSCEELIGFDHCRNCPHSGIMNDGEAFTGHNLHCPQVAQGPYCVSASPYIDDNGEIIGMVETYRDMRALGAFIDDMQTQNIELDHERKRLDSILTDSSDGYFTASLDRIVQSADPKLLELLGKREEEVVGQPCPEVFGSDKCQTDCPILWAHENKKNIIDCREEIDSAAGRMPVDKSVFLHMGRDDEAEHVIGVLHNASEIVELRRNARFSRNFHQLVSRNAKMRELFELVRIFGPTDSAVLILGESGTGKELVASALQDISPRRNARFVKINCSALAESLLESELFGHVRGSFTGANEDKRGLFEVAHRGTLFLDEVGEMSPNLQTKLLRVLEQMEFEKVGGTETIRVDIRIIAATNRDLRQAIKQGSFREDLYYRLNAIQIQLPPLRERPEDIPLLVEEFLHQLNQSRSGKVERISARALDLLQRYSWPGNIRELRNAIEFAHVCARGDRIERQDLPNSVTDPDPENEGGSRGSLKAKDSDTLLPEAMQKYGGDRKRVAEALGISRTTLWRRLKGL